MFWFVSYRLGAFGTIRLPYETRCKTVRANAKVCATKSHWNFSQRNHPIHPIGPFTHVLVNFEPFGCIWDHYVALRNSVQMVRTSAKLRATKSHQNFSQRTHPIHLIGLKTDILLCFILFGCIRDRLVALRNSVQKGPKVRDVMSRRNFLQRMHTIHPIGP